VTGQGGEPPISVRARFERFPATVKGAFVLRGEDPDPHQVSVRAGRLVRLPRGAALDLPLGAVTLDAPPHQDVFVPFEASIVDLEPGWYGFEIDLEVDGIKQSCPGDRRFSVPWPRGSVRTGTLRVDRDVVVGEAAVRVDRIQCTGDSATVRLQVQPPQPIGVELRADGDVVPVLGVTLDEATGDATAMAYPLFRRHRLLGIELSAGRGRGTASAAHGEVHIDLPSA
jgi:hypothetical protein